MKLDRLKSIIFATILVAVGILNMGLHTNLETSKSENRPLQTKPELSVHGFFKEKLTSQIDAYLNDQFMFRDQMIEASKVFESVRGFKTDVQVQTVSGDNMAGASPEMEDSSKIANGAGIQINYFILEDHAFRSFKKNEPSEISYAQAISDFAKENPNVQVFSLVAPTQASYVTGKYQSFTDNPSESIQRIEALMDPSVHFVNTVDVLWKHQREYTFFNTDHHWNGLGAYYGYVTFCEAKGIEPIALEAFEKLEIKDFVGTFYSMTNNEAVKAFPDTIEAYLPLYPVTMTRSYMDENKKVTTLDPVPYAISKKLMGETPSYGVFLGGDASVAVLETESDAVSGKVLVVKDSYGNAFSPYLTNHYQQVHIIDPRYWQGSLKAYIEEHAIEDVIFINNADITLYDVYDEMLRKVF